MTAATFKSTFLPLSATMYRTAYSLLGNPQDAEDAVQEAFIRLWQKRDRLPVNKDLGAYCQTLVRNLCIDEMRRGRLAEDEMTYEVYYWREPARNAAVGDLEVDFVVVRDDEVTAIVVKSGRRGMNSGLPSFVEAFHPKRSFVVGTGGVSLEDFLECEVEAML